MTLSEWRAARNLTLSQVAKEIGVSSMSVSRIEKGAQRPSPQVARRIEALTKGRVSAASLMGLTEASRRSRGVREEAEPFGSKGEIEIQVAVSADQSRFLKKQGIDIEAVARAGAERALKEAEARAWADANREAIEASNRWIEKHGTLAEQLGII
jgi:transcriptional regulator with XRE-family HTH domain